MSIGLTVSRSRSSFSNYYSYTISIAYFKNKYSTLQNIIRVKVSLTYRNHHYTMTLQWSWKVARLGSRSSSRPLFCVPLCNWGKKRIFIQRVFIKLGFIFKSNLSKFLIFKWKDLCIALNGRSKNKHVLQFIIHHFNQSLN